MPSTSNCIVARREWLVHCFNEIAGDVARDTSAARVSWTPAQNALFPSENSRADHLSQITRARALRAAFD